MKELKEEGPEEEEEATIVTNQLMVEILVIGSTGSTNTI